MRRWVAVLAAASVCGASTAAASGPTQEGDPAVDFVLGDPELADGDWEGFFFAGGSGTQSAQGFDFLWRTDANGSIQLDVEDGVLSGVFDMVGGNVLSGGSAQGSLDGAYGLTGSGEVGGSSALPALRGQAASSGSITVSAQGFSRTIDAASPPMPFDFDIVLSGATCNEVYGSFAVAFEQAAGEEGWQADLFGNVVLTRPTTQVQAELDAWLDRFEANLDATADPLPDSAPPSARAFDRVARQYAFWRELLEGNPADPAGQRQALHAEARWVIEAAQDLYIQLHNLSECEEDLLGDLQDRFLNFLTRAIQDAAGDIAEGKEDIAGHEVQSLAQVALAMGGIGPGSPYPAEAARVERALQQAASRILARWLRFDGPECADGCLVGSQEVHDVLVLAVQFGWDLTVDGRAIDAQEMLGRLGPVVDLDEPVVLPVEVSP